MAKSKKKRKRSKSNQRSISNGFVQHGVMVEALPNSTQAVGDCPFCGREERFYVSQETGAWDCKRCGESGGFKRFLQLRGEQNQEKLTGSVALKLSTDRGISTKTLREWRVGWDGYQYTIPIDAAGKTHDLRRFRPGSKTKATTGGNVSLAGIEDKKSDTVWLSEGEWDGMALWESLKLNNLGGSVYAVTGGTSFPTHVVPMFQDKRVIVAFDNDDAGRRGAVRVFRMLQGVAKSMQFVHWPEQLPEKFDVRDLYKRRGKLTISSIRKMLYDRPQGMTAGADEKPKYDGAGLAKEEVIERFREWLYLPDAEVLSVAFGTMFANRLDGDPLWMFLVAPPGGTKTEILMAFNKSPGVVTTATLTPHALMSGAKNIGGVDPSLIPKLNDKVLVVKDFTTILAMPTIQRDEIFGILRDAYDGKTEKYFGNGIHRTYESKFGIIGGVTPVIEMYSASSSMLGERFLKYRLPHSGRKQSGQAIIQAALNNLGKKTKLRKSLQEVAALALNVEVTEDMIPEIPQPMIKRLMSLAQWVAVLRGVVQRERYTNIVQFKPTQEVGTRLATQLAKLGMGVAIFHQTPEFDEDAYQVVVSVARSTVPDRVEEIVKQLFLRARDKFATAKELSEWSFLPENTVRTMLQDLELLRIVVSDGANFNRKYKLSRVMLRMMRPLGLYKSEEQWCSAKHKIRKSKSGRRNK